MMRQCEHVLTKYRIDGTDMRRCHLPLRKRYLPHRGKHSDGRVFWDDEDGQYLSKEDA